MSLGIKDLLRRWSLFALSPQRRITNMENKKKRSPIMVIGFAVLIGFLVIALLNGTIRPSSVVAAKVGLAPGTLLTADLMEVRSVPAGGVVQPAGHSAVLR
jgi:hypothetical protein